MQQFLWTVAVLVSPSALAANLPSGCPVGAPKAVGVSHPLALVVGVGASGSADATAMAQRLREVHGLPARNLCLLTGEAATRANLERAWAAALVNRAAAGDPVLVYVAAPGSLRPDDNGDEPDEWDETLVLAGDRATNELSDDDFQALLDPLAARTTQIGVVVDAAFADCAAGLPEATRCLPPSRRMRQPDTRPTGDGAPGWAVPPGLLVELVTPEGYAPDPSGALTAALLAGDLDVPTDILSANLAQRVGATQTTLTQVRGDAASLFPVPARIRRTPASPVAPPTGRGWLALEGQTGGALTNQRSLHVEIQQASAPTPCQRAPFVPAAPGQEQVLPQCMQFRLVIRAAAELPSPLRVAMVLVTSDGQVLRLDEPGAPVILKPGERWTPGRTLRAVPPLGVRDHVLVLGTPALEGPLPWEGGARDAPWTTSYLALRVDDDPSLARDTRETTLVDFDIRPYLPDNPSSNLRAVLNVADALQRSPTGDGASYQQHDWTQPTDAANLALGIDCSRAIWYAWTRAGLRYNHDDRYLWTGAMVGPQSLMTEEFTDCSADPELRTGDLLVYLDRARGEGHVVMVIDPAHRIAWGSHNTDGNASETPDTGVEYQIIKYRADWLKWDRPGMSRAACWRYKGFSDAATSTRGLDKPCEGSCGAD